MQLNQIRLSELMLSCILIMVIGFSISLFMSGCATPPENEVQKRMERYNVIWNTPSKDPSGVMPFGNGDIAAGVYAIENGDLYLLLAKNDAYTYMGDIFKTGRVRVSLDPNPFISGKPFIQTLDLASGSVQIDADGIQLRIWAGAARPVYHVEVNSPRKIAVTLQPDLWNRFDHCTFNMFDTYDTYSDSVLIPPSGVPTQDVILERDGKILWYYAVGDRSIYPEDLNYYDIEHMASQFPDPFRFNTFGNLLESSGMNLKDGRLTGEGKKFDIRIHALTMQTPQPEEWIETITKQATEPVETRKAWKEHLAWWETFWNHSWIDVTDITVPAGEQGKLNGEASEKGTREETDGAAIVAQSYNVFRFLMACQSRGEIQAKFNGGLFTQQLRVSSPERRLMPTKQADGTWLTHEDDRLWGRRFTFQNQRLLYWPLLRSGDFDMMQPFFNYYWHLLPMRKAITRAWFGHDGAYYRENIEPTGAERDCGRIGKPLKVKPGENKGQGYYHSFYFTSGLEIVAMMIDYVLHTNNKAFREDVLVPFAREVLLFFDQHYQRDDDGKLRLDPAMVLETYWIAINPAPDVAGLRYALDQLLAMEVGTSQDRVTWKRFRNEIPEIPMQMIDGRLAIAPADKWEMKRNAENGELYPVFPFRYFGLGFGTEDIVDWTMKHRSNKDAFGHRCWTQDQIHWAYAGNAAEAADGLVHRFRAASTQCRFPLYGREGPDSCPDLDHFGSGSVALQRMLVQEANGKILLLPAWPANWDVDFRQHLTGGAVISGTVKDGELVRWDIDPISRRNDVVVYEPQKTP